MVNSTEYGISIAHKSKMLKNKDCSGIQILRSHIVLIMLINVTMPTIFDILIFMSMIHLCSVEFSMIFITLGSGTRLHVPKLLNLFYAQLK